MMATILDGKALSQKLQDSLKKEVARLKGEAGGVPHLVNVMIGKEPSACAYANSQKRVAEYIGISYDLETLPANITQKDLVAFVKKLDADASVHGVMLHKPVPAHIDYRAVGNQIDPSKDMEGVNVANIGKMILGDTKIIPCTPAAVMEHIHSTGVLLRGKEAVIVGHSEIVGKPLSMLLLAEYATVTVCHIATSEAGKLTEHIGWADVLIVAVGKPALVKGDWIKEGAVVIDVGINRVGDRIVGDVEFESAKRRASFITPVPGGVGPVTVVMLMRNGIEAFKLQKRIGF
ncbi:MAG: bifunctional 5,10-methylene-tetrahydrofolate dehydrogenase/5,10-methylene-tetrahydrofolate cyclohydrolase [Omnitrophica WOR_2 bacterium RIFCSPHIGHO2_02_FULL_50_17]|nr:MAG: bifunctional 5,10-methylene-tetrahydrofolate dehydrogenase/5,10-methylene-tetrahydrofolate cyclohydrolase [Omnitrophica WOR_2 bacterium RIFCSPHIGHO2_02_FULL_50_17]